MERPELLGEVNECIRRLAVDNDLSGLLDWEFVCECGDEACIEHVSLDLRAYDELKGARGPVLAPGHVPKGVEETRQRAAELRTESSALRSSSIALQNQAQHQQRRAWRLAGEMGWTRLEFRCAECSYGACGRTPPRTCPMCQGTRWQVLPPRHSTAA